jgi:hypothetical protein
MESALLGRPALMFGQSRVSLMPGVRHVPSVTRLPELLAQAIAAPAPSRAQILEGLIAYLRHYGRGCYNDWFTPKSDAEVDQFVRLFAALELRLSQGAVGTPTSSAMVTG